MKIFVETCKYKNRNIVPLQHVVKISLFLMYYQYANIKFIVKKRITLDKLEHFLQTEDINFIFVDPELTAACSVAEYIDDILIGFGELDTFDKLLSSTFIETLPSEDKPAIKELILMIKLWEDGKKFDCLQDFFIRLNNFQSKEKNDKKLFIGQIKIALDRINNFVWNRIKN